MTATKRKGILFCMRFPDDQGFVWRTVVEVRDRVAGLLEEYDSYVAFPHLTGNSQHAIANMRQVELDCYNLDASNKRRLREFVEANAIAGIVYMSALPTSIDLRFLRRLGLTTFNTEQDSFDRSRTDPPHRRLAKFLVRRVLGMQLHDLHIANSKSQGEWLARYAQIPRDRLVVIPDGVDCARYVPVGRPPTGVEAGAKALRVLCVSQARQEKRVDIILRCAAKIIAQSEFAGASFVYVGDGPMMDDWRALAQDLGLGDRFQFAGQQSDLLPWYQGSDVMIHAAERESFGLVLAEAMACGLPVVACAAAGPSEIIADGETGTLVGIDDGDSLQSAIETYMRDRSLIDRHGSAARKRVELCFSMERQVRDMANAIRVVLEKAGG